MNAKKIMSGAFILFAGNLLSSLLGLSREVMSAAYYGADVDMDAYLFANTVPSIALAFFGGVFTAGFIPLFIKERVERRPASASRMFSNTLNWLILLTLILTGLLYLFSHPLAGLFATGEVQRELVERLLWILLPSVLFFGVSYAQTAVLNSLQHFVVPAFLTVLNNAVVIVFIIVFHRQMGIASVAFGYVVGTALQVLVQLPVMRRLGIRYRLTLSMRETYLRRLLYLSLPIIGLGLIDQCILLATRLFAAYLDAGSASALNYANRIVLLPVTLFGTALVSAMYPSVVQLSAERKNQEYAQVVSSCIRSLLLILVPVMAICVTFAPEIIRILLERGAFDAEATRMTAFSFMILAIGILLMPLRDFFTKLFYTKANMKAPILSSLLFLAAFTGGCAALVPWIGYLGIATGTALAMAVTFVFIVAQHKRANPGFRFGVPFSYLLRVAGASALAAALGFLLYRGSMTVASLQPLRSLLAIFAIGLSLVFYAGLVKLLRIREIDFVLDKLTAKLKIGRKRKTAAIPGVQDA